MYLADCIIWETTQYNEFLNHQLAHNIIFVEVEKVLVETAYELLSREVRESALNIQILVNPRVDDFARYHANNTIIITKLTTGSPISRLRPHQPAVEKLIVDVAANKYLKELIGKSEYENMFETIKNRYLVSPLAIKRYANRRTAMKKLSPYLPDSWVVDRDALEKMAGDGE